MKESYDLEFKETITNTFLKTVSAFSNFGDGKILFGITDYGEFVGIENAHDVCLDIENRINDTIQPKPDYSLYVNDSTNVITLEVNEGKFKPYLYRGKAYRRSHTATVEVDQIGLKRLTLEGQNLYFEDLPCNEDSLSFNYFEKKLKEKLSIEKVDNDTLKTFGFYTKDNKINIGGALLADKNSFSGIDLARFGDSISEIKDRETHSGMSVLKQYDAALRMFKRYYQTERIIGSERRTIEKLPEVAFREAIANALVHRTWDVSSHIRVFMFKDKVEIISPGGLPRGMQEREFLKGRVSYLRNPIIANIFFRLHLIEMFGTGVQRIIDAYKDAIDKPTFDITDNTVTVILPIYKSEYMVTEEENKLLNVLDNNLLLMSHDIAKRVGWGKDKTLKIIKQLLEAGYLEKIGSGRNTYYRKVIR